MKFRHEYKLQINYADYITLKSRIKHVLKPDRHTGPDGRYKIRSLYFDDFNDTALYEKIDGVNIREKFRIRYYNNDDSFISLEKKSKVNGLCNKISERITKEETKKIINGDIDFLLSSKKALFIELYHKMKQTGLRPKTIVDYTREPYIYFAGNVRITFDMDIRTGILSTDLFDANLPAVSAAGGIIILEVKYDEFLPKTIQDIIQVDNRCVSAFSKYAACRIYG